MPVQSSSLMTAIQIIAGQIGGSCSKANPYRWRAEELEREGRAEADRREDQLRQERVQAALNRYRRIRAALIVLSFVTLVVFILLECVPILVLDKAEDRVTSLILTLWNVILLICEKLQIISSGHFAQLHLSTLAIFYVYLFYYYPVYDILFNL